MERINYYAYDTPLFYHVTRQANFEAITKEGLKPTIGPLSQMIDEERTCIYLFDSMDSVNDALSGWFGETIEELYGDDEPLCLLAIPSRYVIEPKPTFDSDSQSFEWYTEHIIQPSNIAIHSMGV